MSPYVLAERSGLLDALRERGYTFITPTPLTHARVVARKSGCACDLRDVFGWSLPFKRELIEGDLFQQMQSADALDERSDLFASRFRVSSLGDDLLLHGAYPTSQHDAVFFGPDSYRFAAFIQAELPRFSPISHLVDIGAGAGAGAIAAFRCAEIAHCSLTDVNHAALQLAQANLLNALQRIDTPSGFALEFFQGDRLSDAVSPIHAIIANPPYIADPAHRAYRDGGGLHGGEVSIAWARAAAERLAHGGAFLLYTGTAVIDGQHVIEAPLREALAGFDVSYREIDPDVFGEELAREDYADVERIAVVGVTAVKR